MALISFIVKTESRRLEREIERDRENPQPTLSLITSSDFYQTFIKHPHNSVRKEKKNKLLQDPGRGFVSYCLGRVQRMLT
ncbi:hypothetical protein GWI33_008174 [Rhynchophorus ferrugineus]|uniref:Uncharacterized protein n=1 Tax=Rhynchophorus ferrugineus TaxID=354439 RepID=A0A834IGI2_RHYFE|nr:hypothetical protein GWI33_008174 [Rhynchophorus ferrugineus]